ncbi:MAG: hypothetical protein JO145_08705, partial [Acidobacteriaceae bacterium]|nr:hypothetical protein [Acidobacteriaceae bacterium]
MNKINQMWNGSGLSLRAGLLFHDLYTRDGLVQVDAIFLDELRASNASLYEHLLTARANSAALTPKQHSELIIELAPYLEDFIAGLFGIEKELLELQSRHSELAPLYAVKRRFIQRKALTGYTVEKASAIDGFAIGAELEAFMQEPITERSFANHVSRWLESEPEHTKPLQLASLYAAWATLSPQGKAKHGRGVLFKVPHKLDYHHLVSVQPLITDGLVRLELSSDHWRHREGFQLTDPGTDLTGALDQAHYCIKCHNQGKDSCSTGLKE